VVETGAEEGGGGVLTISAQLREFSIPERFEVVVIVVK